MLPPFSSGHLPAPSFIQEHSFMRRSSEVIQRSFAKALVCDCEFLQDLLLALKALDHSPFRILLCRRQAMDFDRRSRIGQELMRCHCTRMVSVIEPVLPVTEWLRNTTAHRRYSQSRAVVIRVPAFV